MRGLRIGWYAAMAVLLFAARLTGRRELFVLFIMMSAVVLYALALNIWTIMSFSYLQELGAAGAVKGGRAELRVAIYNDKPYPFPLMRLKLETVTRANPPEMRFSLMPRANIAFTVPLACPYRGVFKVGMTVVEVNDSFGLVKMAFRMERLPYYRRPDLKITPRLTELAALPSRRRDAKEWSAAGFADAGEAFSDVRRLRPGDPLKRVHRAISAKRRELYVKTYDRPDEDAVLIFLDTVTGAEGEDSLYLADLACECAAAVAHYSLKTGNRVMLNGEAFLSLNEFDRLLDRLAVMRFEDRETRGAGPYVQALLEAARGRGQSGSVYAVTARDRELAGYDAFLSEGHNIKVIPVRAGGDAASALGLGLVGAPL